MKTQNKHAPGKLKSRDGKRSITVEEFERLFDSGSDEIDEFIDWSRATVQQPAPKRPVTLRLDSDLLDWFKASGPGYQTRINSVLRVYKASREKTR